MSPCSHRACKGVVGIQTFLYLCRGAGLADVLILGMLSPLESGKGEHPSAVPVEQRAVGCPPMG